MQCRLADWLPEEDIGRSLWPEDSLAYTPLNIPDLSHRMQLITKQLIAQATLNKVLVTLGRQPENSLVSAILAAQGESIISKRQAQYLQEVNKQANNAKHLPIMDEEMLDTSASSSAASTQPVAEDSGQGSGSGGGR